MAKNKEIILGVCASIAIYKACEIIRRLKDRGAAVSVVMTKEARELIKPALFANLSGNKVYTDMFESPEQWDIEHISLAEKADLVLIAPATANIIGKIAAGISDDMLTCLVCATSAPVLLAPAMNEKMYLNKITQANILKLKSLGYKFIEPTKGKLACGKVGVGCLADVDKIVAEAIALKK
jgi:phosphopantothenoylcysteine decarboxylase / phosphopantothenate---cysteine ligase